MSSVEAIRGLGDGGGRGETGRAGLSTWDSATHVYAALDLGTNNCRLLVARPTRDSFRIVDAFSRIVRLGEGLGQSGRLAELAMERTIAALEICRQKMESRGVSRTRLIATEACRIASNGVAFLGQVKSRTGLHLDIVDRETEAQLAAAGCSSLMDPQARAALLFDIGGGSSELVWMRQSPGGFERPQRRIQAWTSLRLGVVTLAEEFGGIEVSDAVFDAMVARVLSELAPFMARTAGEPRCPKFHLLGTSGTVTTMAGIHLDLARYDRRRVDGLWMSDTEVEAASARLRGMSYAERCANGCIGPDRADLVLAGCAIFEAIHQAFPASRLRVADRGLREGLLTQMMNADGVWRRPGRHDR